MIIEPTTTQRVQIHPTQDQVHHRPTGRQALVRELPADLETPLSVYL